MSEQDRHDALCSIGVQAGDQTMPCDCSLSRLDSPSPVPVTPDTRALTADRIARRLEAEGFGRAWAMRQTIEAALSEPETFAAPPVATDGWQVGDTVTWSSQAQGCTRTKIGVVAEVVPPGQRPSRERFERLYRGSGVGFSRRRVSYVVLVGNKPYWPIADKLRPAPPADAPQEKV